MIKYQVNILSLCPDSSSSNIVQTERGIAPVYFFDKARSKLIARIISIFSKKPSYILTFPISKLKTTLFQIISELQPDRIILNHYMASWLALILREYCKIPLTYVTQNAEGESLLSIARSIKNPIVQWFTIREAKKIGQIENIVLSKTQFNVAISKEDANLMKHDSNSSPFVVIPAYTNITNIPQVPRTNIKKLMLIGSFRWRIKRENARWLAKKVFPVLRQRFNDLELHIVGANASTLFNRNNSRSGVYIHSDVNNIQEYFSQKAIFVVPERQVGGLKIKVIEAAAHGLPIVSTSQGVSGTYLIHRESCLVADDKESMVSATSELIIDHKLRYRIGKNAYKCAIKYFSRKVVEPLWIKSFVR